MDAFIPFFTGQLPHLETTYQWPKRVPANKPDAPWQFTTNGARECIAMKHHLSSLWAQAEPAQRQQLARWIVADWGGVRTNGAGKINRYADTISSGLVPATLQGVASYSKILSVADCTRYAIYDSRVAAALNAVQLIYGAVEPRYFAHIPSRNRTIRTFTNWFAKQPFTATWKAIGAAEVYNAYCQLLSELKQQFPNYDVYHFEMALFSHAPDLCSRAMEATKPEVYKR